EIERFTLPESFATALYAVIDTAHWDMTYSNAGHPSPLRCRSGVPDLDPLVGRSFPLGMFSDGEYGQSRIQLEPGETVLLYTDGLTEMFVECEPPRSQGELEGIVCQELREEQGVDLERLYRRVLDASCCITSPDDVLLLSIHRRPH
ncbi:MAG: SpoIIE family protein phosphatase, partial [Gammaproteobacteria bacterium]|nr:SpoIIE family protein phosphatase [Gammaproteobacteria bacterium]